MSYVLQLDASLADPAAADLLVATASGPEFISLVPERRWPRFTRRTPRLCFDPRQADEVLDDQATLTQEAFTLSVRREALARTVVLLAADLQSEWTLRSCWVGDKVRDEIHVTAYDLADLIEDSAVERHAVYRVTPTSAPLHALAEALAELRSVEASLPSFPLNEVTIEPRGPANGTLRWRTRARRPASASTYTEGEWTDGGCSLDWSPAQDLLLQPIPDVGETAGPAFLPRADLLRLLAATSGQPIAQRAVAAALVTAHLDFDPESLSPAVRLASTHDWDRFIGHLQQQEYLPQLYADALRSH
ncbi:hypothetical protein [Paraconexibacter sp. AEG42_29]